MSRIFEIKNKKKRQEKIQRKKKKKKKDMKKRTTVALCRSVSSNVSLSLPVFFFPSGVTMASMALLFPTLPLFATSLCPPSSLSQ